MSKSEFAEECVRHLGRMKDKYDDLLKGTFPRVEETGHFGEDCLYLTPALKKFEEQIRRSLDALIKKALGGANYRRAGLGVYFMCQDVFEEWVEIRFPFLISRKGWLTLLAPLDYSLAKFQQTVDSHVTDFKNIYSKSVTSIPCKKEWKCRYLNGWGKILSYRNKLQKDTDFWKLGIPLHDKSVFGDGVRPTKIKNQMEILALGKDRNLSKIYESHRLDGEWRNMKGKDKLDAILRHLKVRTSGLTDDAKREILDAHILILPRPPLIAVTVDLIQRPLATLWVELDPKGPLQLKESTFKNSAEHKRFVELGEHFVKKIILYWKEAKERKSNQEDVLKAIGRNFVQDVATWTDFDTVHKSNPGSKDSSQKKVPEKDPLRPFFFNVKHGLWKVEQLTLKMMVDFWADLYPGVLREDSLFLKFGEAQRVLFWLEEYRDHLVHSLKVYLLGRAILEPQIHWWTESKSFGQIFRRYKIRKKVDKMEVVRFAWASAAFFHDFTIGLEKIEEVVSIFVEKFTSKRPEKTARFEAIQDGLTEWFVGEDLFYAFFASLHNMMRHASDNGKTANLRLPDVFHNLESQSPSAFRDAFFHFMGKGDHGVSAAISYLTQVYPKLQEPIRKDDKKKSKKKQDLATRKRWCKDSLLHFKIAEAILMHSLVFRTIVKPNELKENDANKTRVVHFLPREYDLDFDKNPISFLLALCDTLQDWGRMETKLPNKIKTMREGIKREVELSRRPYGHIESIGHPDDKTVILNVNYKWLGRYKDSGETLEEKRLAFCPWKEGGRYKTHEDAPKDCRDDQDLGRRNQLEFDCFTRNQGAVKNRSSCRIFARNYVYLKDTVAPRMLLGNGRTIRINITYHKDPVNPAKGRRSVTIPL